MTDDLGRVTQAEVDAALAPNGNGKPKPARSPRSGRGLLKLAVLCGAVAVILSQVAQLQTSRARGEQVHELQATIDRLRDRVSLLDAELGCRSIIAGDLDTASAEAEDVILRGLAAIADVGRVNPATLAALALEARDHAADIRRAVEARAKSVEICSSAPPASAP